jgi:3-methyladenine DNA glycosylase AlkD
MMDVIAVLLVVVGFAIGWCLRGCHEDEKAAARAEAAAQRAPQPIGTRSPPERRAPNPSAERTAYR